MTLTEQAQYAEARVPALEDLPKYIAAIRAGMRTNTGPLEEGKDEAVEREEEAEILEMDGEGFIDWIADQALDGDFTYWMFDKDDNFVGMYKVVVPEERQLLPVNLEEGHAGWIVAPAHKGKGFGQFAARDAFIQLAEHGIANVILRGDTEEGCNFIEHIFFGNAQYLRIDDVDVYAVTNPYTTVEYNKYD